MGHHLVVMYVMLSTGRLTCLREICHCLQVSEVTQTDPANLQFAKVCVFLVFAIYFQCVLLH